MTLESVRIAALSVTMCLLIVVPSRDSAAQGALAIATFERAEEAYARGDLQSAVSLVNEAEQLLGRANAPMLHLRILSRYRIVQNDPNYRFETLVSMRQDCRDYRMRFADDQARLDYTRDVIAVCESISSLPGSAEELQQARTAERERVARAQAEQHRREEAQRAAAALAEERQKLQRQISAADDRASSALMGGIVFGGGGLLLMYFADDIAGDDYDLGMVIGLAGFVGALAGGIGLLVSLFEFAEAGDLRNQLRNLEAGRSAYRVGPTFLPEQGRLGIAASIRF
jgi:hypothetical protein